MRRSRLALADIADLETLARAFWRAAKGKRERPEVQRFAARLDEELAALSAAILDGSLVLGEAGVFQIRDPKPRWIHAPAFRERVVHHALMDHLGPLLDRSLVDDTFACRVGKGSLAAVRRAQRHLQRFPWYVQIDVRGFFASVEHRRLAEMLRRRLRDPGLLGLCDRIVAAHQASPGRGLPIGALTSQHFANFYLGGLDRFLLEALQVAGMVRYMDDVVAWCSGREQARVILDGIRGRLAELGLEIRGEGLIQRSACGLSFLGFRIFAGALRLSRRRRRRYARGRRAIEAAYGRGEIGEDGLQAGIDAVLAITAHADAAAWRREELRRRPPPEL